MVKKISLMFILILLALSACQTTAEEAQLEGDPFAIYLVGDPQITGPSAQTYDIDKLPLSEVPLITTADLVSYDWERHGINLTEDAYLKLVVLLMGGMPSSGVPFVIVSYGQPLYAGAFWSFYSSLSFDGVVILQPLDPAGQTLYISLGYPGEKNFTGTDPRGDSRLQQALENAGLIRE